MMSPKRIVLMLLGVGAVALLPGGAPAQPEAMPQACLDRLPADQRISISLRGNDVQITLRVLALQYKVNMIVTEDVTGRSTLDFFQAPVREVFRSIVESANLRCVVTGNVLRVSSAARLRAEEDERRRASDERARIEADTLTKRIEGQQKQADFEATKARGEIREVTIRLAYADAEEVAKTLQGVLGLPPEGAAAPAAPIPGIYAPPPPTNIGTGPAPPTTMPTVAPSQPPDSLGKGLTIRAHKPTNSVFIRYYANDLERIVRLVKEQMDISQAQVQIEARMVITSRTALEQIGIQWGGAVVKKTQPVAVGTGFTPPNVQDTLPNPTQDNPVSNRNLVNLPIGALATAANPAFGLLFGIIGKDFNINLAIQALETIGKARNIAAPNVVTVENTEAIISRGFEVPYVSQSGFGGTNVQFKDALLELRVTPNVINENGIKKIRMRMEINNNEPDFSRAVLGNPPLFKRRGKTDVVIREGERVVIGGILQENAANTIRQVPLLGNIPVLGWLFKSREISGDVNDLIIVVTPTVAVEGARAAAR